MTRFRAACATALWLVCFAGAASGDDLLDTTRLPRMPGAKELFANPVTTIFVTREPVAETAAAVSAALAREGWQAYGPAFAQQADLPNQKHLIFKKGAIGLTAFVSVAPAQGNATSVQYSGVKLAHDLPFPKDAAEVKFDPDRPHLDCVTAAAVAPALDFFRGELGARGWSPWTAPNAPAPTEREAVLFFVRGSERPLLLKIARGEDARTRVRIESVPPSLIAALAKPRNAPEPARPARPAAPSQPSAVDTMIEDTMTKALEGALAEIKGARRPAPQQRSAEAPLGVLAGRAPIPVPATAEDLEHDGAEGTLEFASPSSVAAVAAFYRAQMKPLGWKEGRSVINRPNMVVLDFAKADQDLKLTVMQMGARTNVTARGSALLAAAPKADPADAPAAATPETLAGEDMKGLPVPTRSKVKSVGSTRYRITLDATVPAALDAVLAFYRDELGKRGWTETASARNPKEVTIALKAPEGPAALRLTAGGRDTAVRLTLRKPGEAEKAGLLPKAGQGKLVLGNILQSEVQITVARRSFTLGPGQGSKNPDGPMLDLAPGKYEVAFKMAGKPAERETVTIGADEAWGVIIGPGGALPLHVY